MEKQLSLFDIQPYIKEKRLWYVEIIEEGGKKYVIWLRKNVYNIRQAKKVAAKLYNKEKGFKEECFVNFGKVKEICR